MLQILLGRIYGYYLLLVCVLCFYMHLFLQSVMLNRSSCHKPNPVKAYRYLMPTSSSHGKTKLLGTTIESILVGSSGTSSCERSAMVCRCVVIVVTWRAMTTASRRQRRSRGSSITCATTPIMAPLSPGEWPMVPLSPGEWPVVPLSAGEWPVVKRLNCRCLSELTPSITHWLHLPLDASRVMTLTDSTLCKSVPPVKCTAATAPIICGCFSNASRLIDCWWFFGCLTIGFAACAIASIRGTAHQCTACPACVCVVCCLS